MGGAVGRDSRHAEEDTWIGSGRETAAGSIELLAAANDKHEREDGYRATAVPTEDATDDARQPGGDTGAASAVRRAGAAVGRVLLWVPPACRYDPDKPPAFTLGLNVLFSFSTTATVANLYYNQSILYKMADTFGVSYESASHIATLMQAGYVSGLVLLVPLADVLQRRPFILALVALTAVLWTGLCTTGSFAVFSGLSFVVGFTTVTPQLMFPLVGELAPPHRRAGALAIVVSGMSLGMLVARLLAGVVANYTSWRNVYWVGLGLQAVVLALLFAFMPDYPTKNTVVAVVRDDDDGGGGGGGGRLRHVGRRTAQYALMLYGGIAVAVVRHPALAQACLVMFCLSAVFTDYWTTLSFLLASPPYEYSPATIGLFGLIGIVVICLGPLYGRHVLQRLVPVVAVLIGTALELVGVGLGVGLGPVSVAGPVVQAVLVDFGNQGSNVALRMTIFGLDPRAQNRINSAYMVASFCGQLTGTSAGNRLYAQGGWRASGALSLGLIGFAMAVCLARGPRERGWVGWHGGWAILQDSQATGGKETSDGEEVVVVGDMKGDAKV